MESPLFKKKKRTAPKTAPLSAGRALAEEQDDTASPPQQLADSASVVTRREVKLSKDSLAPARNSAQADASKNAPSSLHHETPEDASQPFKVRKSKLSMAMVTGRVGRCDDTQASTQDESRTHPSRYSASVLADLKATTPSSSAALRPMGDGSKDHEERQQLDIEKDGQSRSRSANQETSDFISLSSDALVPRRARHYSEKMEEEDVPLSTKAARVLENEKGQNMRKAFADAQIASEEEASEVDETSLPHQRWADTQLAKWQTVRESDTVASHGVVAPLPGISAVADTGILSQRLRQKRADLLQTIEQRKVGLEQHQERMRGLLTDDGYSVDRVRQLEEKDRFYIDFQELIISVGSFLAEKSPELEAIERDWCRFRRQAVSLKLTERANQLATTCRLVESTRLQAALQACLPEDHLSADMQDQERGSSDLEWLISEQSARLKSIFSDVEAPEYLRPAFHDHDGGRIDSRSILSHFHQWRHHYQDDYDRCWGGLSLASTWEFWARKEVVSMLLGDAAHISTDHITWLEPIHEYVAAVEAPLGGDEEISQQIIARAVVPVFQRAIAEGAVNPWDTELQRNLCALLRDIDDLLDPKLPAVVQCATDYLMGCVRGLRAITDAIQGEVHGPPVHCAPGAPTVFQEGHALLAATFAWLGNGATLPADVVACGLQAADHFASAALRADPRAFAETLPQLVALLPARIGTPESCLPRTLAVISTKL